MGEFDLAIGDETYSSCGYHARHDRKLADALRGGVMTSTTARLRFAFLVPFVGASAILLGIGVAAMPRNDAGVKPRWTGSAVCSATSNYGSNPI